MSRRNAKAKRAATRSLTQQIILVRQRWLRIRRRHFARQSKFRSYNTYRRALISLLAFLPTFLVVFVARSPLLSGTPIHDWRRELVLATVGFGPHFLGIIWLSYRGICPHKSRKHADHQHTGIINIFVKASKTTVLKLNPHDKIDDVLAELRRRRIIPRSAKSRARHLLYFPPNGFQPLCPDDSLNKIGAKNNSTLYLQFSVRGGARPDHRSTSTAFTPATGQFNANLPDIWYVDRGHFRCKVCNNKQVARRYMDTHVKSEAHRVRLPHWQAEQATQQSTSAARSEASRSLIGLLESMAPYGALQNPSISEDDWVNPDTGTIDWSSVQEYTDHVTHEDRALLHLSKQLRDFLVADGTIDLGSDDSDEERDVDDTVAPDLVPPDEEEEGEESVGVGHVHGRRHVTGDEHDPWFPWPDKETCVVDILRHVPRCAFSEKQNTVIHWALCVFGIDAPSERSMKDIDNALQRICGISSIRFSGALVHIYYVNDMATIIAQEMANPRVRRHLRFLPEDAGKRLSEAWQADRWLKELDVTLGTPMVQSANQDYFVHEPAMLRNDRVTLPVRWFTRDKEIWARTWKMTPSTTAEGWIVHDDKEYDVPLSDFLVSFPHLVETFVARALPDPRKILGVKGGITSYISLRPWAHTDPLIGNPWRVKARGHHVVAFPIWLYCDDTSGNISKKWNKHNSFLFTAAGLPRKFVHREYNIHFLSTSNIAPPLEMLDGIVEQLREAQTHGIWAWDCKGHDKVLVIPSVFAMLGDNPMQSEIACHIGMMGKLFCWVCWAGSRGDGDESSSLPADQVEDDGDDGDDSDRSSVISNLSADASSDGEQPTRKGRKKRPETMAEMVSRVTQFMKIVTVSRAQLIFRVMSHVVARVTVTSGTCCQGHMT